MIKRLSLIVVLLFLFIQLSVSFSVIEQFTVYDSKITFNDDSTFTVERTIHIRNIHDVGIVPGEFEFELFSSEDETLNVTHFEVYDRYNNEIKSELIQNRDRTSLILNLFTPVLPGFESVVKMKYTVEYQQSGWLFKRAQIPLKENTRLPILSGKVQIEIEDKFAFTYLSYTDNSTILNSNNVTYEINENSPQHILIEYSKIPIHIGNYPGSLVFWLLINFIMIGILGFQFTKEMRKLNKNE